MVSNEELKGVSSLRNDYGDAHGKGGKDIAPVQRRTELVITLVGSLSTFIIDTYKSRRPK